MTSLTSSILAQSNNNSPSSQQHKRNPPRRRHVACVQGDLHGQTIQVGKNARDEAFTLLSNMAIEMKNSETYFVFHISCAALTFFCAVSSVNGGLRFAMVGISGDMKSNLSSGQIAKLRSLTASKPGWDP